MSDQIELIKIETIDTLPTESATYAEPDAPASRDVAGSVDKVSIIIPFSRPDSVDKAIESVLEQDHSTGPLEVILVGRGSSVYSQGRDEIIAIETGPIFQPGKARNIGAAKATGDFLIFLDDDCQARGRWIYENLAELRSPEVGAVGGKVASKSGSVVGRAVDFSNFGQCQIDLRQERPICSASFGIRKSVFDEVGGFDESLLVHEDIDFCHRLELAGYKTVYNPLVQVHHNHERNSFSAMLAYLYQGGRRGGLEIEEKYKELSGLYRFLLLLKNPILYFGMLLPISLAATLRTVFVNAREHKEAIPLSPLILLGKISCHLGIWRHILESHLRGSWRKIGALFNARRVVEYSLFKGGFRTPRVLTLFVTSQCNAKCGHCFYWQSLNQPTDLSFEEIEDLSRSLGKLDKLLITGGEPFMQRKLPEIIQLFFENNNCRFVSIPTNGLLPELIARRTRRILHFAQGRTVNISMSLDGTAHTHDELRGVPGNFEKMIETYRQLKQVQSDYGNLSLRVNSVVMNATLEGVEQLIDELPNLMPEINTPALTLLRGSPLDKSLLLPNPKKLKELHDRKNARVPGQQPFIWRFADWATFTMATETLRQDKQVVPCEAGRILGVVEADGTVKHCELLPAIGNLRDASFVEIWESDNAKKARDDIRKGKCKCTHECNLFPSMLSHPVKSAKALAKAHIRAGTTEE